MQAGSRSMKKSEGGHEMQKRKIGEALCPIRDKAVIAKKFGVTYAGDHLEINSSSEIICKSVDDIMPI